VKRAPSAPRRPATAWARRAAALLPALLLAGCDPSVLDPHGAVGRGDSTILIDSVVIMTAIVAPTIAATLAFAWWYRASNPKARYRPDFEYSGQVELITWSIPLLTIMLLGGVIWVGSHELDPYKPLPSSQPPLEVQVVSLDWKWLFIYPGPHVASVNKLVIPVDRPVHFTLTSGSVMTAFFIPQLGSMIYTMNHMATQLYLDADKPGVYLGEASQFSGDGFSGMHFDVDVAPEDRFDAWLDDARRGGGPTLSAQSYRELERQSENVAPIVYRDVEPNLFDKIVSLALPPAPGPGTSAHHDSSGPTEK